MTHRNPLRRTFKSLSLSILVYGQVAPFLLANRMKHSCSPHVATRAPSAQSGEATRSAIPVGRVSGQVPSFFARWLRSGIGKSLLKCAGWISSTTSLSMSAHSGEQPSSWFRFSPKSFTACGQWRLLRRVQPLLPDRQYNQHSQVGAEIWEGDERSKTLKSILRARRFTEWPKPLHWIAFL